MSGVAALPDHPDAPDLFRGGLLYRVMHRFGVDPERAARAARRAALAGFLLWAPMAVAAFLEGNALPGSVAMPFLLDVAAYVRPLVVVPLLLIAEPILARAWRFAGAKLRERGLVGPECRDAFDALVARVTRSVNGVVPELVCAALAASGAWKLVSTVLSEPRDAWFATTEDGATRLTFAGAWAGFVVHAILFYLTLRWLWLLLLWYRFLFGVARLPLRLLPAHPDRAAGLGLVGRTISAGAPLVFAWSAALCAAVANRMIFAGARLVDFTPVGIVMAVAVLLIFILPPALIFLPLLVRTRLHALEDWSRRLARTAEDGSVEAPSVVARTDAGGIHDLQDIAVAVDAVRAMQPVPVLLSQLVVPLAAAAAPIVPLLFLAFPAKEIFDQIVRLVF